MLSLPKKSTTNSLKIYKKINLGSFGDIAKQNSTQKVLLGIEASYIINHNVLDFVWLIKLLLDFVVTSR